jgi:pimeloyl-ACP methyl ester carboxylesterase
MSEPDVNEGGSAAPDRRRNKSGPIVFDIEVDPVDPERVAIGADATGPEGVHLAVEPAGEPTVRLRHNRIELALHRLRDAREPDVRPLLHLHGLAECTPADPSASAASWPGEVWGLDFTGHGRSTIPHGGGYTAELLMGDVDAALAHLGQVTVVGRGLGAYVALLVAGARPTLVHGAVLLDGPGIVGGGIGPSTPRITLAPLRGTTPDPFALAELTVDVRPPDYALTYLHLAVQGSDLATPVSLAGRVRPPWMAAIEQEPGVAVTNVTDALAGYLRRASSGSGPPTPRA